MSRATEGMCEREECKNASIIGSMFCGPDGCITEGEDEDGD